MTLTLLLNREGFFSRKDNYGCSQATGNLSDTSSNSDDNVNAIEHAGASSSQMVPTVHYEKSEPNNNASDRLGISGGQNCSQGTTCESLDRQDSASSVETRDWALSSSFGVETRDVSVQNVVMVTTEDADNDLTQQSMQMEGREHSNMQVSEVHIEQSELGDITDDESNLSHHNNRVEGNIDDVDWDDSVALEGEQQEEAITENDGSDWHQTNVEWSSTEESVDDNQLSSLSNELPQNILGNEDGENSRLQEAPEVWQEDSGFQEAVEIWLGGPSSDHESAPVGRIHGFYFPEDDNVYSVELRELLSRYVDMTEEFQHISFENQKCNFECLFSLCRRSVSNLLRSSFRESLDQLIQSYVERQTHAHVEWELQEATPFSPSAEQDLEQQGREQIVGTEGAVNSSLGVPLPPTPPPLPIWDRHSRHDNWSQHDINNQRLGIVRSFIGHNCFSLADVHHILDNRQSTFSTLY